MGSMGPEMDKLKEQSDMKTLDGRKVYFANMKKIQREFGVTVSKSFAPLAQVRSIYYLVEHGQ